MDRMRGQNRRCAGRLLSVYTVMLGPLNQRMIQTSVSCAIGDLADRKIAAVVLLLEAINVRGCQNYPKKRAADHCRPLSMNDGFVAHQDSV